MHEVMESLLSPVDKAVLSGDLVDWVHAASIRGLEPGYDGWLDDDAAIVRPWGFDLRDNRVPVLIQAGEQDRFVPYAHAHWLVENISEATDALSTDDGHLTLLADFQRTVHWLRGPPLSRQRFAEGQPGSTREGVRIRHERSMGWPLRGGMGWPLRGGMGWPLRGGMGWPLRGGMGCLLDRPTRRVWDSICNFIPPAGKRRRRCERSSSRLCALLRRTRRR